MEEVWRPIKGFEGFYEVSSLGRVRSIRRNIILKHFTDKDGYRQATMSLGGTKRAYLIHRLVCEAWYGPPPFEGARALHKDDNKDNYDPTNLYWGTAKDNADDRNRNGTKYAKFTWEQIRNIRQLRRDGHSIPKLSKMYSVNSRAIYDIVTNRSWVE